MGLLLKRYEELWGLDFDAFVVDRKYYDKGLKIFGKDVLCLDDIKSNDCILIRSIANYTQLDELKKNFCVTLKWTVWLAH